MMMHWTIPSQMLERKKGSNTYINIYGQYKRNDAISFKKDFYIEIAGSLFTASFNFESMTLAYTKVVFKSR